MIRRVLYLSRRHGGAMTDKGRGKKRQVKDREEGSEYGVGRTTAYDSTRG
jgi:hypothetical protein